MSLKQVVIKIVSLTLIELIYSVDKENARVF